MWYKVYSIWYLVYSIRYMASNDPRKLWFLESPLVLGPGFRTRLQDPSVSVVVGAPMIYLVRPEFVVERPDLGNDYP